MTASQTAAEPLGSESERPLGDPGGDEGASGAPTACDVCEAPLGPDSFYRQVAVVSDMAPRTPSMRSPQVLEEQWDLIVCESCHADFCRWLFRSESELDTLPAPPTEPGASAAL